MISTQNINELLFMETVTLTSLTKMKSVGVFDEKSYDQPTSGLEHDWTGIKSYTASLCILK